MKRSLIVLVLAAMAACSKSDAPAPAPAPAVTVTPLASTLPTELAKDVDAAQQTGKWADLKQRWQGQHVTWTVWRHELLCGSAARCNVSAFPVQRPAKHGWLPELQFAGGGEYAKIEAACGKADCEIKIDGVMAEVRGSDAEPAAMRIADVKVVSATRG
nr:hypothetical protein [Kofleriaceae bacterium]